jgi:hypothetical protein
MNSLRLFASFALLLSFGCSNKASDSELGGSTDVPLAQAGNTITTGTVTVGGQSVDIGGSMQVLSNEGGVATVRLRAKLANSAALAQYGSLVPSTMKASDGSLDFTTKFRVTTEGVQDTLNRDGEFHTTVKYGGAVGDTYRLEKSNGTSITRTVTAKSDQDDFPYGMYNIKTITVEQDSRVPGIKKFVIRANHKFGIVYFQIVADDGSTASTYLYSAV